MSDSPLDDIRIGQISHQWAEAQKIKSFYFKNTDSTNQQAKDKAFDEESFSEHLIIYIADQQTAGRGRGKNTWLSPQSGSQLLSTWSFMLDAPTLPIISPLVGLALYKAACATWPYLDWSLKAPNDLFIGEKKIAGLLLETISQGDDHRLLIGLGFNVISSPKDLVTAVSLAHSLPADTPLLAEDWLSFLERLVFEFSFSIQQSFEPLNPSARQALLYTLNKNPLLDEDYTSIDESANLKTNSKYISWQEL